MVRRGRTLQPCDYLPGTSKRSAGLVQGLGLHRTHTTFPMAGRRRPLPPIHTRPGSGQVVFLHGTCGLKLLRVFIDS